MRSFDCYYRCVLNQLQLTLKLMISRWSYAMINLSYIGNLPKKSRVSNIIIYKLNIPDISRLWKLLTWLMKGWMIADHTLLKEIKRLRLLRILGFEHYSKIATHTWVRCNLIVFLIYVVLDCEMNECLLRCIRLQDTHCAIFSACKERLLDLKILSTSNIDQSNLKSTQQIWLYITWLIWPWFLWLQTYNVSSPLI